MFLVNLTKKLTVKFKNERGVGDGLQKEYTSILRDMFESSLEWDGKHTLLEGE